MATLIDPQLQADIEKKQQNNIFSTLSEVLEILKEELVESVARTVVSYLCYVESTLGRKLTQNYVCAPLIDRCVPCLIISPPRQQTGPYKLCLSSIRLQTGWFPSYIGTGNKWPVHRRYYCYIQRFEPLTLHIAIILATWTGTEHF